MLLMTFFFGLAKVYYIKLMGITDSRAVLAKIEADYKSIRKYCDPVYG